MTVVQQNIGIRIRLMPGARILMIVTKKLIAPASVATPRIWRPMIQKSVFSPGEYSFEVSGE
jgi:hypothetical protein